MPKLNYTLLNSLRFPQDLRKLNDSQQKLLCREIRHQLIHTIAQTGGHLASNLGVVELTVALHTVFELPQDQIVWDVGHQCYTHKMLTGRLDRFSSIRQAGGLSGFPRCAEHESDAFVGGHASTSVSAACGLAKAKTLTNDPHHVVAVVGDGAFTGGMIYEALNNAGRSDDRLIVILNDNDMSISKSVGSFARYLADKRASDRYVHLKDRVEDTLVKIPVIGEGVRDSIAGMKTVFRQAMYHSNFFEDFGFDYLGPVDGHNIPTLIRVLRRAQALDKPVVVHINTVKGKGYSFAEQNPSRFHGVSGFDKSSGAVNPSAKSFSSVFGQQLVSLAREDKKICAITAAMQSGTGLELFAQEFLTQNRFFDVGIAEEHAITFACGLAAGNLLPVFAVYSTFLQRGFDQLIHDAAIEKRHIVLAIDRAGIVGEDGETHQGLFDTAFLSAIPNTVVYSPATYAELAYALEQCLYHTEAIAAVRYPRGGEISMGQYDDYTVGDYFYHSNGGKTLLITYGRQFAETAQAADLLVEQGECPDLLKLHRIFPIPDACISIAKRYREVVFVEEGIRSGGIGEHFLAELAARNYRGRMHMIAIDAPFIAQMSARQALVQCGLDAQSLAKTIAELIG